MTVRHRRSGKVVNASQEHKQPGKDSIEILRHVLQVVNSVVQRLAAGFSRLLSVGAHIPIGRTSATRDDQNQVSPTNRRNAATPVSNCPVQPIRHSRG